MDSPLLARGEGCGCEQPAGKTPDEDSEAHRRVARNIKKFIATFLILDATVLFSYGQKAWADAEDRSQWGVGQALEAMVVGCFSFDVVLACALLWAICSWGPWPTTHWEDYYGLVATNWLSNIASLAVLAAHRLFKAWGEGRPVAVAVVYVGLRAAKLRPLGRLEQALAHARAEPGEAHRYHGLLATWAVKRSNWADKLLATSFVIGVTVIVAALAFAIVWDAMAGLALQGPPGEAAAPPARSPTSFLAADHFSDAADGAVAGGAFGAYFGPDAAPVGAAIGAVAGALFR